MLFVTKYYVYIYISFSKIQLAVPAYFQKDTEIYTLVTHFIGVE